MCHDETTLLAVQFPYAAPRPASCDAALAITPLTTLLTYGTTSAAGLLQALSLPSGYALLSKDAVKVRGAAVRMVGRCACARPGAAVRMAGRCACARPPRPQPCRPFPPAPPSH